MKRITVGISIIFIVILLGCGKSNEELLIDNFFSSISAKDEKGFLETLDNESQEFWKDFELTFDDLIYKNVTWWSIVEIKEINDNLKKVRIEAEYGNMIKNNITLDIVKEETWKIRIKDIFLPQLRAISSQCFGNLRILGITNTNYSTDHKGKYAPDIVDLVLKKYLDEIPKCPSCGKDYKYELKEDGFIFYCPCPEKHLNPKTNKKAKKVCYISGKGIVIE